MWEMSDVWLWGVVWVLLLEKSNAFRETRFSRFGFRETECSNLLELVEQSLHGGEDSGIGPSAKSSGSRSTTFMNAFSENLPQL